MVSIMTSTAVKERRRFTQNVSGLAALTLLAFIFGMSDPVASAFGAPGIMAGLMLACVGIAGMAATVTLVSARTVTALLAAGSVALLAFAAAVAMADNI